MPRHLELGRGADGEFERLRAIFARLGAAAADLGDDAALVPMGDTTLCASIDCAYEGVHFRTDWLTFEEIGWRAGAAALSDLAAEGAKPLGLLVSLGLPQTDNREPRTDPGADIMAGIAAVATSVGAKVLGGDLIKSDKYLVDVCVLGTARHPVRRAGARPGDALWVTGTLGGSLLALRRLKAGQVLHGGLRSRVAHPEPRIAAGEWLAAQGATAMIDISDGLSGDAGHLAAASQVALEIALERLPCWEGADPLTAVASGEEYELLVALPASFGDEGAHGFQRDVGIRLTRVGTCAAGAGRERERVRFTDRGQPVTVPAGYDHFAVDPT
jgi:thiamine-monophosphate kinase